MWLLYDVVRSLILKTACSEVTIKSTIELGNYGFLKIKCNFYIRRGADHTKLEFERKIFNHKFNFFTV